MGIRKLSTWKGGETYPASKIAKIFKNIDFSLIGNYSKAYSMNLSVDPKTGYLWRGSNSSWAEYYWKMDRNGNIITEFPSVGFCTDYAVKADSDVVGFYDPNSSLVNVIRPDGFKTSISGGSSGYSFDVYGGRVFTTKAIYDVSTATPILVKSFTNEGSLPTQYTAICFDGIANVYCGYGTGLYKKDYNGENISSITIPNETRNIIKIGANKDNVFAITDGGTLYVLDKNLNVIKKYVDINYTDADVSNARKGIISDGSENILFILDAKGSFLKLTFNSPYSSYGYVNGVDIYGDEVFTGRQNSFYKYKAEVTTQ